MGRSEENNYMLGFTFCFPTFSLWRNFSRVTKILYFKNRARGIWTEEQNWDFQRNAKISDQATRIHSQLRAITKTVEMTGAWSGIPNFRLRLIFHFSRALLNWEKGTIKQLSLQLLVPSLKFKISGWFSSLASGGPIFHLFFFYLFWSSLSVITQVAKCINW